MPILENSPWRKQYFEGVACPNDVTIPTDDDVAYALYPDHRWVYNKLLICETQGLRHAPHGIAPVEFPVFSKPIYNLRGMGIGTRTIRSFAEYERHQTPGHMWMELLTGQHVSTDVAVVAGVPVWWRHAIGVPLGNGVFDYWIVSAEARPEIERHCRSWLLGHLKNYTGMMNFETIGGKIIDAHLRFTDQWPDLYGRGWIESLVELYAHKHWRDADAPARTGYSVVLSGEHGPHYRMIDPSLVAALRSEFEISSIQFTFHEDKPPEAHAMPPGGFRLAIINCWDLDAGMACRRKLAPLFSRRVRDSRA
jgi:hypothetical protein